MGSLTATGAQAHSNASTLAQGEALAASGQDVYSDEYEETGVSTADTETLAQEEEPVEVSKKERKKIVEAIAADYTDWGRAEVSAKLQSSLLPVSVTLRMYMEKNKSIMISGRAPILGEVLRIELDNDSVLILNKMKSTYCKMPVENLTRVYPDPLQDIQSILLNRIVIAGAGELGKRTADAVEIFTTASELVIVPAPEYNYPEYPYGYVCDAEGRITATIFQSERINIALDTQYCNDKRYTDIKWEEWEAGGVRTVEATLVFDPVKYGASPMSPVSIKSKYKRVSLRDVLRF